MEEYSKQETVAPGNNLPPLDSVPENTPMVTKSRRKKSPFVLLFLVLLAVIALVAVYLWQNPNVIVLDPKSPSGTPPVSSEKAIYRQEDVVSGEFVISTAFELPEFPVFYIVRNDHEDASQLWVMNKDGAEKKFTGVTGLLGGITNVPEFGGVLYAVDDSKGDYYQKEPRIYYFITENKKTVAVQDIKAIDGTLTVLSNAVLSPSGRYIAFEHLRQQAAERVDEKRTFYVFDLTSGRSEILAQQPSTMIKWSYNEDALLYATEAGYYKYEVGTKNTSEVQKLSIEEIFPDEGNIEMITSDLALTMLTRTVSNSNESDMLVKLELTNGTVIEPETEFTGLQPFFCVSPDRGSVLYTFDRIVNSEENFSFGVKLFTIKSGTRKLISPTQQKDEESYYASPCYWTSNDTVIIEKQVMKESDTDFTLEVRLAELNLQTMQVTELKDAALDKASHSFR